MAVPFGVYARISADREGRELGVQRQVDDSVAMVENAGDHVVRVYCDNDISASTRSRKVRPEYNQMLADVRSGLIRGIAAYKSSRITRRPRENEDLIELAEKYGTVFRYVASPAFDLGTANGRTVARILAATDAGEPEGLSEQARRQRLQKAMAGEFLGGRPSFGYTVDGMGVVEEQAAFVADAYERFLARESLGEIARRFNRAGLRTAHGGEWGYDTMRRLLMRARYAGLIELGGEILGKGKWPAIVDEETWRAARAILTDPKRRREHSSDRIYLGTGVFLCGVCDDGTTVRSTVVNKGQRAYKCRLHAHLTRAAEPVDDMVQRYMVERLREPDSVNLLTSNSDVDLRDLHRQAEEIRHQINEADDDRAEGVIDRGRWMRITERLRARLVEVERSLNASARGSVLNGLVGNPDIVRIWYGEAADGSDGLSISRKAAVVKDLAVVTLLPARRGRQPDGTYFDPSRVRIEWREDD